MKSSRAISPLVGIQEAVGDSVEVAFSVGAYGSFPHSFFSDLESNSFQTLIFFNFFTLHPLS